MKRERSKKGYECIYTRKIWSIRSMTKIASLLLFFIVGSIASLDAKQAIPGYNRMVEGNLVFHFQPRSP